MRMHKYAETVDSLLAIIFFECIPYVHFLRHWCLIKIVVHSQILIKTPPMLLDFP